MKYHILPLLKNMADILLPRHCYICNRRLLHTENYFCVECWTKLTFTNIHGEEGNSIERIFWGKVPIMRANSLIHYQSHNYTSLPILQLKYFNNPECGVFLGRCMAEDLLDTTFFNGIDFIIPVPLTKKRMKTRGYNQSEMLAKGVAEITGIPLVTNVVYRRIDNSTQTKLTAIERVENVKNIFSVIDSESIRGKHLLLIDDVITTGATLLSCAETLCQTEEVKVSILTAYVAGFHSKGISYHGAPSPINL